MRAFPNMLEYQEAIQNPGQCLADADLAGGTVVLDPLGLPKPITGGFASVYQIKTRKKHFAVRCFIRSHAGVQDRYARISAFQRQHRPKWMAEFDYIAQGIRVRGQQYPILKMEWVQGEQLNLYVDQLVAKKDKKGLKALIDKVAGLLETMGRLGVAHGDLQHGNVLVAGGELMLIDYDAMYIPGMTGQSHEVGHRNFQHPKRSERDFGPGLDHFSAWVILLSLKALAIEPHLWRSLDGGDEGLLLRKEDFVKPEASKALNEMERIADAELKQDLAYFKQCLGGEAGAVASPLAKPAKAAKVVSAPAGGGMANAGASATVARIVSAPATAATVVQPAATPAPAARSVAASAAPTVASSTVVSSKTGWGRRKAPSTPPPTVLTAGAGASSLPSESSPQHLAAPVGPERALLGLVLAAYAMGAYVFLQATGAATLATVRIWTQQLAAAAGLPRSIVTETTLAAMAGLPLALLALFLVFRYARLPQVQRLAQLRGELDDVTAELARSEIRKQALAEIEATFATARRLDFEALTEQIATREGQALLARIMEYLDEQELSDASASGIEPEVSRQLARGGLRSALRLQDVIVSRSMADGETEESLAVLLRNGRRLAPEGLTRPQAEALLRWRGALERQFVATSQGEEKTRQTQLAQRAADLTKTVELYAGVNGWAFLGRIVGLG